jgi:hypothetical protein
MFARNWNRTMNEYSDVGIVVMSIAMKIKAFALFIVQAVVCYVLSMWVPTQTFAEVMFLSIVLNMLSGLAASIKNKVSFQWKKALLIPLKCILYPLASMTMYRYQVVYGIELPIVEIVTGTLAGFELVSAGGNYQKIFGVSFLDAIMETVKGRFNTKS